MKKLTNKGKEFIRAICSGTSNSLIVGNYKYNLPFSDVSDTTTVFSATANDHAGNPIVTNAQLAEALIVWYNEYGEANDVDSNVLAAQGFVGSGYRLWHYDKFRSGSGISNFHSRRVYSHMVNANLPQTLEALETNRLLSSEVSKITQGLTEPDQPTSYKYGGYGVAPESIEIAIGNRQQLHQNIMDNPELSIKTQAALLKEILLRNDALTANSLFAYSRDILLQETNYRLMLDNAGRKYGDDYVRDGIVYVKRVFGVLGDENNDKQPKVKYKKPKGKYFGFDINFELDNFKSFLG